MWQQLQGPPSIACGNMGTGHIHSNLYQEAPQQFLPSKSSSIDLIYSERALESYWSKDGFCSVRSTSIILRAFRPVLGLNNCCASKSLLCQSFAYLCLLECLLLPISNISVSVGREMPSKIEFVPLTSKFIKMLNNWISNKRKADKDFRLTHEA